jgi:hypothetical protein
MDWMFKGMTGDEAMAAGTIGVMFLIPVVWIVVKLFFIRSQNKFIDVLAREGETISKVWTWTQLIPLVSMIAELIIIDKFDNNFKNFSDSHQLSGKGRLAYFNPIWGWIQLILSFIWIAWDMDLEIMWTIWVGVMNTCLLPVFFIIYWTNISKSTANILAYYEKK